MALLQEYGAGAGTDRGSRRLVRAVAGDTETGGRRNRWVWRSWRSLPDKGEWGVLVVICRWWSGGIQVIVIVYAECWDLTRLMVRWQYPLLHGRLLTAAADDVDGRVLWVLVYEGEAGGILLGERDLVCHPWVPRTSPPAHSLPNSPSIRGGRESRMVLTL